MQNGKREDVCWKTRHGAFMSCESSPLIWWLSIYLSIYLICGFSISTNSLHMRKVHPLLLPPSLLPLWKCTNLETGLFCDVINTHQVSAPPHNASSVERSGKATVFFFTGGCKQWTRHGIFCCAGDFCGIIVDYFGGKKGAKSLAIGLTWDLWDLITAKSEAGLANMTRASMHESSTASFFFFLADHEYRGLTLLLLLLLLPPLLLSPLGRM